MFLKSYKQLKLLCFIRNSLKPYVNGKVLIMSYIFEGFAHAEAGIALEVKATHYLRKQRMIYWLLRSLMKNNSISFLNLQEDTLIT